MLNPSFGSIDPGPGSSPGQALRRGDIFVGRLELTGIDISRELLEPNCPGWFELEFGFDLVIDRFGLFFVAQGTDLDGDFG